MPVATSLPDLWEQWKSAYKEFRRVNRLVGHLVPPWPIDLKRANDAVSRRMRELDRAIVMARATTLEDVNVKLQWLADHDKIFNPPEGYIGRLARDMAKIVETS